MSIQDVIKNSVLEAFAYGGNLTVDAVLEIMLSLVISFVVGLVIYRVYRIFFGGVVFSRSFAATLVGMCVLTCMVTLAISTNIVISLGMVGALSIVRFRTAIKDPMDLLYLFWAITGGITIGAGMYLLAFAGSIMMILVIALLYARQKKSGIYILVVHYEGDMAGDQVIRELGKIKSQLKSKTLRVEVTEMTIELACRKDNTVFTERIRNIEGVKDVTLIEYN